MRTLPFKQYNTEFVKFPRILDKKRETAFFLSIFCRKMQILFLPDKTEENLMKATGIVRRIDDLGRVVVPKEIRRVLRIREGDPLEIYTGNAGEVILKKYSPISELSQFADEYAETVSKVLGATILVSDTDQVISAWGSGKKEYADKKVDNELDKIIQSKNRYLNDSKIVVPIISQGDPIGSITILQKTGKTLGDAELKAAEIGAGFLARQMEN